MSALENLQQYGCSSPSDSESDFLGFDLENDTAERFPQTKPAGAPNQLGRYDEARASAETKQMKRDSTSLEQPSSNSATYCCDSDGSSIVSEPALKERCRKKTKKEMRKENSVEKRRTSHPILLKNCGCRKECNSKFARDDRLQFYETFWNLDNVGQTNLIRKYVHLVPVRRRRVRNVKNLAKRLAYTYTLPCSSGDPVVVCRKFLLNTLGFGEHCG